MGLASMGWRTHTPATDTPRLALGTRLHASARTTIPFITLPPRWFFDNVKGGEPAHLDMVGERLDTKSGFLFCGLTSPRLTELLRLLAPFSSVQSGPG